MAVCLLCAILPEDIASSGFALGCAVTSGDTTNAYRRRPPPRDAFEAWLLNRPLLSSRRNDRLDVAAGVERSFVRGV